MVSKKTIISEMIFLLLVGVSSVYYCAIVGESHLVIGF